MPGGREGIRYTLAAMVKFRDVYKTHPIIRQLATRLIANLNQKDYEGEAHALFDFVQSRIRYVRDTDGVELVQSPLKILEHASGDCDDKALLLATMLASIGFKTRFRAVGFGHGICHVFCEVLINGEWVSCDATEPQIMGWEPPLITENEYMDGLFSKIKKLVKTSVKAVRAPGKATLEIVKGGDATQSLKESLVTTHRAVMTARKELTPAQQRELEDKSVDAAAKLLNSPLGGIIVTILSFIPITAPFAWLASVARTVAIAEAKRKELSEAYKKASLAQQKDFDTFRDNARWVYDPTLSAIRLRKPGNVDDALPEYVMEGETLTLIDEGKIPVNESFPVNQEGDTIAPPNTTTPPSTPPPAALIPDVKPCESKPMPGALKLALTVGSILLLS
jgi:hypothetical protein